MKLLLRRTLVLRIYIPAIRLSKIKKHQALYFLTAETIILTNPMLLLSYNHLVEGFLLLNCSSKINSCCIGFQIFCVFVLNLLYTGLYTKFYGLINIYLIVLWKTNFILEIGFPKAYHYFYFMV